MCANHKSFDREALIWECVRISPTLVFLHLFKLAKNKRKQVYAHKS